MRSTEGSRVEESCLYHTVLGVKDRAVLASPGLVAFHLAHLLHSYSKISTDLPSCAGMALMERGPLIRNGRATASVFGSYQSTKRLVWTLPPCKDRAPAHTHIWRARHWTAHKSAERQGVANVGGGRAVRHLHQHLPLPHCAKFTGGWGVG